MGIDKAVNWVMLMWAYIKLPLEIVMEGHEQRLMYGLDSSASRNGDL